VLQAERDCLLGRPSRTTGPFFAETQADIVLSFGRILGGVSKSATTRTLPGYSNAVTIGGVNTTGQFVASFIPNALKVWSGEIDRTRSNLRRCRRHRSDASDAGPCAG